MKLSILIPLALAASLAQANDFVNGSFEDPAIAPQSVFEVGAGALPGWAVNDSVIITNGYDGVGSSTTWHNTPAGSQYLYIGISTGANAIAQDVTLSAGLQKVSFLQADFASDFNVPGGAVSLSVTRVSDGMVISSPVTFDTPAYGDFMSKSLIFNAPTAEAYTFTFSSISGHAGIIDDVHVAAVPEPATMAALGLGAAGLLRRRRKS